MTTLDGRRARGLRHPAPAAAGAGGTQARTAWGDEPVPAFAARTGGAYGALGTALVLVGVGADHLRHHATASALLLPLAAGVLVLAVLALRGPGGHLRVAGPVTTAAAAAGAGVGLVTDRAGAAELWLLVLGVAGGVLLAVAARLDDAGRTTRADGDPATDRGDRTGPAAPAAHGAGRLAALVLAGLLASAATVQGLAATSAGEHAVPHGLHGLPAGGHHG